ETSSRLPDMRPINRDTLYLSILDAIPDGKAFRTFPGIAPAKEKAPKGRLKRWDCCHNGGLSEFRSSGDVEERDFSLKLHATIDAGP
ncbi:hypothetical protein, partial [Mesorhizobium sp. Mes31]|uniref:hypothetical protein n=1 Tax=Mesorhizobium sp. Mes31 TaxID=2926017 RepID=UPI002119912E